MHRVKNNGVVYLCHPEWETIPGLKHGLFTRIGGVSTLPYSTLNTGPFTEDRPENIRENLRRIASAFSTSVERIVCSAQVHGIRIHHVTDSVEHHSLFTGRKPYEGDGLLTDRKDLFLGTFTADCLPVLFYDPERPAVGTGHAGWRGTLQGITAEILAQMRDAYGSRVQAIHVLLGPAIGPCCYTVGEEVASAFLDRDKGYEPYVIASDTNTWRIDLAGINRYQLLCKGVGEPNIVSSQVCTSCQRNLFFSVRAQGEPTGRQISLIGLTNERTNGSG